MCQKTAKVFVPSSHGVKEWFEHCFPATSAASVPDGGNTVAQNIIIWCYRKQKTRPGKSIQNKGVDWIPIHAIIAIAFLGDLVDLN